MIIKKFISIFSWALLIVVAFIFLSCKSNTTDTDNNNPINGPTKEITERKGLCADQDLQFCAGSLKNPEGKKRFCFIDNGKCTEAKTCEQLGNIYCEQGQYIDDKKCGKRNNKCSELFDCNSFALKADCKEQQTDDSNKVCAWSVKGNKCVAQNENYLKQNQALKLYSGAGTVCADTIYDDFLCWGDDSGKKYSAGFPDFKIKDIQFSHDFGCAVVETKAPKHYSGADGEYGVRCWGANASIVNNTPQGKIDRYSLNVKDRVACVLQKENAETRALCWGDYDASLGIANPLRLDAQRRLSLAGNPLDVSQVALGDGFICAEYYFMPNKKQLICSGLVKFSPLKIITAPLEARSLTAGEKAACFLYDDIPHKDLAQCFEQPGDGTTFNKQYVFGPMTFGKYSIEQLNYPKAQGEYFCGINKADKKLICYGAAAPGPIPNLNFSEAGYTYGNDYICGIVENTRKVHCWGSDKGVVDKIPTALKDN